MPRRPAFDPGEFLVLLCYGLVLLGVLLAADYRRRMRELPEIGRATTKAEFDAADAEYRRAPGPPAALPMSQK